MPELAAKTTFVWVGFYGTTLAYFPPLKPTPLATPGAHVWVQPTPPDTVLGVTGDAGINTGIYVRSILAQPSISLPSKYVLSQTELLTMAQILEIWKEVTGKEGKYLECSVEGYDELWPVMGKELGIQLEFNKAAPDWETFQEGILTDKDLGIQERLVRFEEALKGLAGS